MHIVIAGGSGFLGRALAAHLASRSTIHVLTRRPRAGHSQDVSWTPDGRTGAWARVIDGAHAVINLAGEGIADRRWTQARKAALRDSRLLATHSLAAAIQEASTPPGAFISASGVGYYGPRADEILDESAPPGSDFLATLCVDWERAARAASGRTRVALIRTGLVLEPSGGALQRLLWPFKLGAGGPIGSGRQYFPWIHRDDWVRLVSWMVDTDASGPFNASAPQAITNAEFAEALGRALHRPAVIPVPAFALRLALGELADSLLTGQRVTPAHAQALGFQFQFPTIDLALADLL